MRNVCGDEGEGERWGVRGMAIRTIWEKGERWCGTRNGDREEGAGIKGRERRWRKENGERGGRGLTAEEEGEGGSISAQVGGKGVSVKLTVDGGMKLRD